MGKIIGSYKSLPVTMFDSNTVPSTNKVFIVIFVVKFTILRA